MREYAVAPIHTDNPIGVSFGPAICRREVAMQLPIDPSACIHCLYGEMIDLALFGHLAVRRASFVEPDIGGDWFADLSPVKGPCLGPFRRRSEALEAERRWLEDNWLNGTNADGSLLTS